MFASLTMMFVVPLFDEFIDEIYKTLKPGSVFISFDPNYLYPVSVYRRFSDKTNNQLGYLTLFLLATIKTRGI